MVLGMGPYDDPIIGNKIKTMDTICHLLIGSYDF